MDGNQKVIDLWDKCYSSHRIAEMLGLSVEEVESIIDEPSNYGKEVNNDLRQDGFNQ